MYLMSFLLGVSCLLSLCGLFVLAEFLKFPVSTSCEFCPCEITSVYLLFVIHVGTLDCQSFSIIRFPTLDYHCWIPFKRVALSFSLPRLFWFRLSCGFFVCQSLSIILIPSLDYHWWIPFKRACSSYCVVLVWCVWVRAIVAQFYCFFVWFSSVYSVKRVVLLLLTCWFVWFFHPTTIRGFQRSWRFWNALSNIVINLMVS